MQQAQIEIVNSPRTMRNQGDSQKMSPTFGPAIMGFAVVIPYALHSLALPYSRPVLIAYELLCEATLTIGVVWYVLMRSHSAVRRMALLASSFSLTCLSLASAPQLSSLSMFGQFNLFHSLSLLGLCLVFVALAKASHADIFFYTSASALALIFYAIQHRYLLVPVSAPTPDLGFVIFSRVYSAIGACGVALATLHSLRTLDKLEFTLACAFLLMFALDFAARHSLIAPPHETTTLAQCLWVSTVAALCVIFFLNHMKAPTTNGFSGAQTAD